MIEVIFFNLLHAFFLIFARESCEACDWILDLVKGSILESGIIDIFLNSFNNIIDSNL